jgi:hypothetical protein
MLKINLFINKTNSKIINVKICLIKTRNNFFKGKSSFNN